jgi:hypothetical protein
MPEVTAIQAASTGYPADADSILQAIVDAIVTEDDTLAEFTAANVTLVWPQDAPKKVDDLVQDTLAKCKGLSLLVMPGDATNPEIELPGPRMMCEFELELYVHPALRADAAASALELTVALARFLHHKVIEIAGFTWHEIIYINGWSLQPDPDFTVYAIRGVRDMQF